MLFSRFFCPFIFLILCKFAYCINLFNSYNGYTDARLFSNIEPDDIEDIERFIQIDLLQIVQDKCQQENLVFNDLLQVNFFGFYFKDVANFTFSDSDKMLIKRLSNYCNDVLHSQGLDKGIAYFEKIDENDSDKKSSDWYFYDKWEPITFEKQIDDQNSLTMSLTVNNLIIEKGFVYEPKKIQQTQNVLEKLLSTVKHNASRPRSGWRYDDDIQNWAAYLRMRAGPLAYNDLQRNLEGALPSLSTTNRYIKRSNTSIVEGILRSHELLHIFRKKICHYM